MNFRDKQATNYLNTDHLGEADNILELMAHLLPRTDDREQAAFLFVRETKADGKITFDVRESYLVDRREFAAQYADYLELSDETRIRLFNPSSPCSEIRAQAKGSK